MLSFQASIGALNDLHDEAADRGRKPGKPLPRRVAGRHAARVMVVVAATAGLALAAPSGLTTLLIGALGLAAGYLYDLSLSRTPWSWLPLALGLPLLPLFAWVGASGTLHPGLIALVPVAVVAGAALALANGIADHDRDAAAEAATAAVVLGRGRAWTLHVALLIVLVALLTVLFPRGPSASAPIVKTVGLILLAAGAALSASEAASRRERGWELEAVGVAIVGVAWVEALSGLG